MSLCGGLAWWFGGSREFNKKSQTLHFFQNPTCFFCSRGRLASGDRHRSQSHGLGETTPGETFETCRSGDDQTFTGMFLVSWSWQVIIPTPTNQRKPRPRKPRPRKPWLRVLMISGVLAKNCIVDCVSHELFPFQLSFPNPHSIPATTAGSAVIPHISGRVA